MNSEKVTSLINNLKQLPLDLIQPRLFDGNVKTTKCGAVMEMRCIISRYYIFLLDIKTNEITEVHYISPSTSLVMNKEGIITKDDVFEIDMKVDNKVKVASLIGDAIDTTLTTSFSSKEDVLSYISQHEWQPVDVISFLYEIDSDTMENYLYTILYNAMSKWSNEVAVNFLLQLSNNDFQTFCTFLCGKQKSEEEIQFSVNEKDFTEFIKAAVKKLDLTWTEMIRSVLASSVLIGFTTDNSKFIDMFNCTIGTLKPHQIVTALYFMKQYDYEVNNVDWNNTPANIDGLLTKLVDTWDNARKTEFYECICMGKWSDTFTSKVKSLLAVN